MLGGQGPDESRAQAGVRPQIQRLSRMAGAGVIIHTTAPLYRSGEPSASTPLLRLRTRGIRHLKRLEVGFLAPHTVRPRSRSTGYQPTALVDKMSKPQLDPGRIMTVAVSWPSASYKRLSRVNEGMANCGSKLGVNGGAAAINDEQSSCCIKTASHMDNRYVEC